MRTHGRRAAIGATSLALLAAAAGTSLAAVRAARDESDLVTSATSRPAPEEAAKSGGAGTSLPATADPTPGAPTVPRPGGGDPSAPPAIGGGPDSAAAPGAAAGPADQPAAAPPAGSPGGPAPQPDPGALAPAPGQDGGPRPVPQPSRPSSAAVCPSDEASGALPVRPGRLQAVSYTLPWPGIGPLTLAPQASATRAAGSSVKVVRSSIGGLASDGATLTVAAPTTLAYSLAAGDETASGTIRFTPLGATVPTTSQGCRDRRFVLYDVGRAALDGSPLRIVGVVAPPGTVTLDDDGGAARFRSSMPGAHAVLLLTASDAGVPGPLVTTTVNIL